MPTFLNGLPLHPLIVHAVVVLVPLMVLGGIVVAVWPAARRRYGSLVVGIGVVALVSTVLAEQAGEGLQHSLPPDAAIEAHARLGDNLKLWVGLLLVLTAAFLLLHRRTDRAVPATPSSGPGTATAPTRTGPNRVVAGVLALLVVGVAVMTGLRVYQTGDSGAQAVWGGRVYEQQPR